MYKSSPSNSNGIYISKTILFAVILPIFFVVLIGIGFLISYLTTPVESMILEQTENQAETVIAVDADKENETSSLSAESSESVEQTQEQQEQLEPEVTEQPEQAEPTQEAEDTSSEEESDDDDDDDDNYSSSYGRLSRTDNAGESYYKSLYYFGGIEISNLALYTGLPDDHVITYDKGFSTEIAVKDKLFKLGGTYRTGTEALEYYNPRAVVMCFGRDGGTYMSVTTYKNYYRKLIQDVQDRLPNTQIILMSVFPVTLAYERSEYELNRDEEYGPYDNEKIVEMNAALQDLAKELRVYYLAADGVVRFNDMPASPLNPDYCHTDGVLLSRAANEKVEDYIKEHKIPNY